jgi:hypothetical protein
MTRQQPNMHLGTSELQDVYGSLRPDCMRMPASAAWSGVNSMPPNPACVSANAMMGPPSPIIAFALQHVIPMY